MRNLLLSLSLVLVGFTTAAHADTVSADRLYDFTGTTSSGATGTGTISTTASGSVTGGAIAFTGGSGNQTFNFSYTSSTYGYNQIVLASSTGLKFNLNLASALTGPTAAATVACSSSAPCITSTPGTPTYTCIGFGACFYFPGPSIPGVLYSNYGDDRLSSGLLTPRLDQIVTPTSAATPEPSSLILLGTGILGMAGAARRRFLPRA